MMTLEEAIKHCKDVALSCSNKECALEHFQLLKWLQEYSDMLKKQGEKKPADKVEPKFHKGQWIVWQDKCYEVNYNGCGYELVDQNGLSTSLEYGTINESAHLWDVAKDAKPGDVLVVGDEDGKGIAICGKNDRLGNNILYCYYDDENGFTINTPIALGCLLHPANKDQCNLLFQKMRGAGYKWDDKKKELKKIVEPKFNVGKWIACEELNTARIINIDDDRYEVEFIDGSKGFPHIDYVDRLFHLWNISDAKNGDVLATWAGAFIYNGNNGGGSCPGSYCGINTLGNFQVGKEHHWTGKNVFPATKEQREQLEKAMADAGYTFDFEKKELKKTNEEFNGEDYGIGSLFHAQRILEKTLGKVDGYQSDDGILDHKCAITAVKKLYKQKPIEWHREDEHNLNACLGYIPDEFLRRWLKDVIPVKYDKSDWSEEDERSIRDSIFYLKSAKKYFEKDDDIVWDEKWFSLCIKWLESLYKRLQPQNTWKPSDEQIEVLQKSIKAYNEVSFPTEVRVLSSLCNELKKL